MLTRAAALPPRVGVYQGHTRAVVQLLVLGDMLLSLGADRRLLVWRIGQHDEPEVGGQRAGLLNVGPCQHPCPSALLSALLPRARPPVCGGQVSLWSIVLPCMPPIRTQVAIEFDAGFVPTALAHPDTYLNKVVVGAADGRLQLWNFVTASCLHTFEGW